MIISCSCAMTESSQARCPLHGYDEHACIGCTGETHGWSCPLADPIKDIRDFIERARRHR